MSKRKKQPRGNPARDGLSFAARVVVRDFEKWMASSPQVLTDPVRAGAELAQVHAFAARAGLDILNPEHTEAVAELLLELDPDSDPALDVFHDYVHFEVEQSSENSPWSDAHEALDGLLSADDGLPAALADALDDAMMLDPAAQRDALAGVVIIARVRDVLTWIGPGRPITDSQALRRADIAQVAALLGISARGVAKRPVEAPRGELQVQSMWELPILAAWWEALSLAEVIELSGTRVRRGPRASGWLDGTTPALDDAGMVVGMFVAQLLSSGLNPESSTWNSALMRVKVTRAIAALDPNGDDAIELNSLEQVMLPSAARMMSDFARVGLAMSEGAERYRVPQLLRGTFARGVMLGMRLAAGILEVDESEADSDDEYGSGYDEPTPFDDPEVRAEMARLGITHKPGLAAEMMGELAPLLAEEGIDISNPDANDLDALNSALARATERHNLALFTPVGEHRAMGLSVHRLVTEALAEGSVSLARVVVDGIQPEPVGTMPSVAQVIGVGLGTLDTWSRDPSLKFGIAHAQVPTWNPAANRVARDILRAARGGEAFAQLDHVMRRQSGKPVLEGALLAVAGSVIALAARDGVEVRELVGRLLVAET